MTVSFDFFVFDFLTAVEDLKKALQMPAAEFLEVYKFDKPQTTDTNIVFASLKSVKSSAALEIAHKLGFNK